MADMGDMSDMGVEFDDRCSYGPRDLQEISVAAGWVAAVSRDHVILVRSDKAPQMISLSRLSPGDTIPYDESDGSPDIIPTGPII